MSGYRVMAGVGVLDRDACSADFQKPDVLPDNGSGTQVPVYSSSATKANKGDCLHQLTHRMGAGLTLSIDRARNLNYITELGMREFATSTAGMYDVNFSLDGVFAPQYCGEWLANVFMMGEGNTNVNHAVEFKITPDKTINIYSDKDFGTYVGTMNNTIGSTPSVTLLPASQYYIAEVVTPGTPPVLHKFYKPVLGKDLINYAEFVYGSIQSEVRGGEIKLFAYNNLEGPKYFDLGYQKINAHASGVAKYDGYNEIGVLLGCICDSATISYESGSDAGVKFSISGYALIDYEQITTDSFDYAGILDDIPTDIFVGGCVSVFDTDGYKPVAQTDSASIQISNNVSKLGNCLKLNYSSYAIGTLAYELSTATYSNDPNKYMKYFYGYEADLQNNSITFVGKQPKPIKFMKIRTDDTSALVKAGEEKMFMDINMSDTYVGDMSHNFSVDSPIMDEPAMRTKKLFIAVGYTPSSVMVTFDQDYTGAPSAEVKKEFYGRNYTIPTPPTRSGYEFKGWYTGKSGAGTQITSNTVVNATSNFTVYAKWEEREAITVTFDYDYDDPSTKVTKLETYGATYELPSTPSRRTGYEFNGWYTGHNGSGTQITGSTIVTTASDHTVYAYWKRAKYDIYFEDDGATWVKTKPTSYTYGSTVSLPTSPQYLFKEGYSFEGWYEDDEFTGERIYEIRSTDHGDKDFYAKWVSSS